LISATVTTIGLATKADYDSKWHPTGFMITDKQVATVPFDLMISKASGITPSLPNQTRQP
jgi:hypothetical protein